MISQNHIRPLYVTLSTDLGSYSSSIALNNILESKFDFFHLDLRTFDSNYNIFRKIVVLAKKILKLRKEVRKASKRGSKIIFFNLKPALFTFDLWDSTNSITCSDFSHSLFNWHRKIKIQKDIRFYFQKILFGRFYRILTWTENLRQCIHDVYGIPFEKIIKVPLPLELELLGKIPSSVNGIPKVLFVGGDFERKGGDFLVDSWESKLKGKCELILVTQKKMSFSNGIRVINNITKGSKDHVDLFQSSDIFILPTNQDAFPYVLGEAAISGLTIITSKFALGAPEVIIHGKSGYISETSAGCIDYLLLLLDDIEKINEFKFKMFENIINKVSKDNIVREYLLAIE